MALKPNPRVRLALYGNLLSQVKDVLTGSAPVATKGNPLRIDLGLFSLVDGQPMDVGSVGSILAEIVDPANVDGARLVSQGTTTAPDNTMTAATWAAGTGQHAIITLTSAQTNQTLSGSTTYANGRLPSKVFYLVFSAIDAGTTTPYPLGYTLLTLLDAGTPTTSPGSPPAVGVGGTVIAINDVGGGTPTSLEAVATDGLALPQLRTIYVTATDELQDWLLVASTAASNVAAGIQRPNDYSTSNQRVWFRKSP